MSSPPIKTGAGPRNVTSSKYVLTSAQAKNVDSRPPYPNSADDNGASDVDISIRTPCFVGAHWGAQSFVKLWEFDEHLKSVGDTCFIIFF